MKQHKTFVIKNKASQDMWVAQSGKYHWKQAVHAKSAFANSKSKVRDDPLLNRFVEGLDDIESLKFDNQEVYEIVELPSVQPKPKVNTKEVIKLTNKLKKVERIVYGEEDLLWMVNNIKEILRDD